MKLRGAVRGFLPGAEGCAAPVHFGPSRLWGVAGTEARERVSGQDDGHCSDNSPFRDGLAIGNNFG